MIGDVRLLKKTGRFIKKHRVLFLSFFLPPLILEIAYICQLIYPFGKWDILIIDLWHQYAPFISDLQDKIRNFSNPLYSWTGGLGASFLPQFAYYLASPLNLLVVLFPKAFLTEAILVLTLLKVGLAGACFAWYLKGVHREENFSTVAFSLLYALSGYVMAYSWNIMWLDSIFLLPLIILGLVKLVRGESGLFFCITLALALFTNFYMAFFICLFVLLYYPVCLFSHSGIKPVGDLFKKTLRFAGYSLLSGGLSAVLLLPTFFALRLTSAVDDIFPKNLTHYFDIFDYITRHYTLASPAIREGMPNIYCGIIVLILIPAYFFLSSISIKEKLLNMLLFFVLILSLNINMLNFIWHGFHYPNQLPHRFAFVYIFLILSISYKGFNRLHELSRKQVGTFCSVVLVLIVLSQKFDDVHFEIYSLYASLVFVIVYAAVITAINTSKLNPSKKALFFLLAVAAEITVNTIVNTIQVNMNEGFTLRDGYSSGTEVAQIREQISKLSQKDKSFYRIEVLPPKTTNDPHLYNYRGLSIFSSTFPEGPVDMMQNLGYHSNGINSYKYEGSTILLDSVFAVKYLIHRSPVIDERLYREIVSTGEISVFENPYALPLGFLASQGLANLSISRSNPFNNQNVFMDYICGVKDIFRPIGVKPGNHINMTFNSSTSTYFNFKRTNKDIGSTARINIPVEQDQQVYLYLDTTANVIKNGFIMIGDKKIDFNASRSTIINPGFCEAGTTLEMNLVFDESAPQTGSFHVYAYGLNLEEFEKAISLIRKNTLEIEKYSDTRIRGNIDADKDGYLLMTIPYDKGWHVKVDGEKAETKPVSNGLLAIELSAGSHTIELWFVPEHFYTGLAITSVSLAILVLLFIRKLKSV